MRNLFLLGVIACAALPAQEHAGKYELPPEQRTGGIKRIFVVCHSHLDIGFTRPPDEVARDYKDNIDAAIRLTRDHSDFRWTIESAWMLEEWLRRTQDEALVAELGTMLRQGRMGLGVAFANMHSGLMGPEESNRLVYLGERFRRRFGLSGTVAYQNDVPGFTWAYPRVLAGSGVRRLVLGLNLFIGGGNNLGVSRNPFYWVGPDGSRVLTYFSYDSYVEGYRWNLGGRFALADLERTVPRRLAWLERNGYQYDTYLLMASPGDNSHPEGAFRILERIREWNRAHPELPMKMVLAEEFFDYLQERYGDSFTSASGDAAGHWEIVKLRVPEAASKMRLVASELPAAETASTIASLLAKSAFPRFDLAEAWSALLSFHEHTADSGGGWPGYFSRADADWSNTAFYAAALNGYSASAQILRKALAQLGNGSVGVSPGPAQTQTAHVLVYNGLSWQRSGPAIIEGLPAPLREGNLEIVDRSSGEQMPWEALPGTKRHVLFYPKDVPPVGYRVYEVRKGSEAPRKGSAGFTVKVDLNSQGWIGAITDATTGRPMVTSGAERPFGALLLARGREDYKVEKIGSAQVEVSDGPVAHRIRMLRAGTLLPLTEAVVYRGAPYVDLQFNVNLGTVRDTSGAGARFALALPLAPSRQLYLDGAGFVARVPQDILPGGKAPQFTPVQFLHQQTGDAWGITLASRDCAVFRPDDMFVLASESLQAATREEGTQELYRTEPRSSAVLVFRFRMAAQPENKAEWKRLAAEYHLPLRAQVLAAGATPVASRSFFSVDNTHVQMLAFKPAEDRPGWYVIRLQDNSGKGARVKLTSAFQVQEAQRASLVEQPEGGPVELSLRPWETLTILVRLRP